MFHVEGENGAKSMVWLGALRKKAQSTQDLRLHLLQTAPTSSIWTSLHWNLKQALQIW